MSVIIQEEATGCGIASAANILQKPYAEVKAAANAMGIFADDDKLSSNTQYVRSLLKKYGIAVSASESPFTSWRELPNTALLAIKYHEKDHRSFWHWVVFKREYGKPVVLDSAAYLEENRRTDFQNMRPKWFIDVLST